LKTKSRPTKKAPIESALANLKNAHQNRDIAGIDSSMEALNQAWATVSQDLYNSSNTEANNNSSAQQEATTDAGGAQDVEFEEVK
jgi:molecular chaperone DnaK